MPVHGDQYRPIKFDSMKQGLDVVLWERCLDDSDGKGEVRLSLRRAAETRNGEEGGEQRTGALDHSSF